MRNFEIVAALLLAASLFVILKVIGMMVKFAAIAAVIGFVAGLFLARAFRRPKNGSGTFGSGPR